MASLGLFSLSELELATQRVSRVDLALRPRRPTDMVSSVGAGEEKTRAETVRGGIALASLVGDDW
jgi:hypothetical protein